MNTIQKTFELGQAVWLDFIRRSMFKSGALAELVNLGVSGLTANPTIMEKAILGSTDYDEALQKMLKTEKKADEIYETLAVEDIREAADLFRPVYDRTNGEHGYACLEINPLLAYNTDRTISEGRRLFLRLQRPNVMIKIPATIQGIEAIRHLTGEGFSINATLIFSLEVYREVIEAYISGTEDFVRKGGNPQQVCSVASFFLSRIDTAVDNILEDRIRDNGEQLKPLLGKTAVSSAKLAYQLFTRTFFGERFRNLKEKGVRMQRPLWASTGTKNPAYSDIKYVESLIGPDTVNTMPLAAVNAFLDHGKAELTIDQGLLEAERTMIALETAGINLKKITGNLLEDGVKAFEKFYQKLLLSLEEKRTKIMISEALSRSDMDLGKYEKEVKNTLAGLKEKDTAKRIWKKDFTLWKPQPDIMNSLGWLNIIDIMQEQRASLNAFAAEVRNDDFAFVVLLGMGGSSLGTEVLRQSFGATKGFPQLIVLDSTVPAAVQTVSNTIDPEHTLFLVSSKSGSTTETMVLYSYFRGLVEKTKAKDPGRNFATITDPGSPLVTLAGEQGFRRCFLNPADIGGRYSVLSYFGTVPAELMGIDTSRLLDRAQGLQAACFSSVPDEDNPGIRLGALMGCMAKHGKDKLTLLTSPLIASFGLWVEQLVAESLGKESKGIIPISGEPLTLPSVYGDDRFFVCLRLKGDDNLALDTAIDKIKSAGQPFLILELQDKYDLGAEFFRWEFATAVAGAVLEVNPFDQPDVELAKIMTRQMLKDFTSSGRLPVEVVPGNLNDLLAKAGPGKYFAILAFMQQTPEIDQVFNDFRLWANDRFQMPAVVGYGPRYLHSTGQLFKGGPDSGLFMEFTANHETDLPIPGSPYTLGTVTDAEALGDLKALSSLGRKVVRIHLDKADASLIRKIVEHAEAKKR